MFISFLSSWPILYCSWSTRDWPYRLRPLKRESHQSAGNRCPDESMHVFWAIWNWCFYLISITILCLLIPCSPPIGLTDSILKEIADNLETDEQMESLARALGRNRGQINQCHATNRMTGSVTTRGTVDLLTAWKATVQPENQMSSMQSAMTSARLLNLRDTVLLLGKVKACRRCCSRVCIKALDLKFKGC